MGKKIELVKQGAIKSIRAQALGINRKNIYRVSILEGKDLIIKEEIEKTHKKHPAYGHRRLGWHLEINPKRIRRIMRKYDIRVPRRKIKNNFCTRSVKHRRYPNLIKDLGIIYENQVWCSDTSRFIFHGSKWYIVTVIDIFTRQVLGVAIGRHHDSALVRQALEMALLTSKRAPDIFHSDQGTEFMAEDSTDFMNYSTLRFAAGGVSVKS